MDQAEEFKTKFEESCFKEITIFSSQNRNTYSGIVEEFKLLLKSINSQV
jgi:hypothetical protein